MIGFALAAHTFFFLLLCSVLFYRGYANVYSGLFIYLAFHFMVFVQRPLAVHLFGLDSEFLFMGFHPDEGVFLKTLFVADLGLLAFTLAYIAALGFRPHFPTLATPPITQRHVTSVAAAALILSPLILYSFFLAFTMRQAYDTDVLFELSRLNISIDPTTGARLLTDTTAYVLFARYMAFPFSLFFAVATGNRWWSYGPLTFCLLVALQLGERWPLVIGVLVTLLAVLYARRQMTFRVRHYLIIVVALLGFVVVGQNRNAILAGDFDLDVSLSDSSFGNHPDFANFEFLTYVVGKVPEVSGTFSYFTQYLGVLTQPIPRAIWADKPVGSPVNLVNLQAYGRFASRTPSLVGDGWMSLGYAGIVVTLGLVGAFYGRMFRRFCRPDVSIYFFCAYFWMIALLLQWARDGSYKILDFFLFCVGPIGLAALIDRFMPQRSRNIAGRSPTIARR
ncbi:oligosaccharide repeat unit polymerase [Terrihabitans sp. B22-R8]|uniref:oligosaccharide repeat unit polymerase n=1 Tax=Terrihabitans sp. B22-R8 TaxID=3425128 RepID=UPI00403CD27B